MSLNTQIIGDPQGCRQYGGWLRALGDGALATSDLLSQIRGQSDFCWDDHVGDLFRLQMEGGKRDASVLYDVISRVGDAVNKFADDLATAIASMNEARTVAHDSGDGRLEVEQPAFNHNLAIYGWDLRDALSKSTGWCRRRIADNPAHRNWIPTKLLVHNDG